MNTTIHTGSQTPLSALLICPNRELAESFSQAAAGAQCFQILADVKTYLADQVLELRLRQLTPGAVLLDLTTDIETACGVMRFLDIRFPHVPVIGLHTRQDSDGLVRALRAGASDCLWAPFESEAQFLVAARIGQLRRAEESAASEAGVVIGFASTKPGSGASTLASQMAFALQSLSGKKVLLADLDLLGGSIGFYLKLHHSFSVVEALGLADQGGAAGWQNHVAHQRGVDILPGPEEPFSAEIDPAKLHLTVQVARRNYDFVILDLPTIFQKISLLGFSETDAAFLVTTPELPSLHLTHKALGMLSHLGFDKGKYSVIVNRLRKQDGLGGGDLERMFGAPIRASLPNDYSSLHRAVTRGEPVESTGELGKAIAGLAANLAGKPAAGNKLSRGLFGAKPVYSQV